MIMFLLVLSARVPASLVLGLVLGAVVHLRDGERPVGPTVGDPAVDAGDVIRLIEHREASHAELSPPMLTG
jgi:hypothetical protein